MKKISFFEIFFQIVSVVLFVFILIMIAFALIGKEFVDAFLAGMGTWYCLNIGRNSLFPEELK